MKTAVIVLLAFVAMASARAQGVHIVDHNPEQVQIGRPGRRYTNVYNPYRDPSQVQIVEHNPDEKVNVVNPFPDGNVIHNVDPGFNMPHNPYPPHGGYQGPSSPPHGGYQRPYAEPEYVRNPDGSLYYANQHQQPSPYNDPMARGGK